MGHSASLTEKRNYHKSYGMWEKSGKKWGKWAKIGGGKGGLGRPSFSSCKAYATGCDHVKTNALLFFFPFRSRFWYFQWREDPASVSFALCCHDVPKFNLSDNDTSEYQTAITLILWNRRGGVLSTKVYPGTCRWNGSQNQPPGITMTPYSVQKLV